MRIHRRNLRGLNKKKVAFQTKPVFHLFLISTKNNSRLILKKKHYNRNLKRFENNIIISKTAKQMKLKTSMENSFALGVTFGKLIRKYTKKVNIFFFKGLSSQKIHVVRGLKLSAQSNFKFKIKKVMDITNIPHNGCRPKKLRRLKHLRA